MDAPYVSIGSADELTPGKMKRVDIGGHRYLVVNVDNEYFCVDDTCSHEDSSLYLGCLKGDMIKCSLHGSRFSLRTGQPQEEPADEPINTYRICESDGQLWVDPNHAINC